MTPGQILEADFFHEYVKTGMSAQEPTFYRSYKMTDL